MARTPKPEPVPGLVVVDKPAGWTSHDVVGRMRRLAHTRKVGHAGTLDPMATGVLVIGIGRATRLLTYIVGHDKQYTATIRLGESTVTDDAEGEVTATVDASSVTDEAIADAVAELTGDIQQVPSSVSAIKVDGVRSYKRARDGEAVELAARPVTVSEFAVLDVRRADARVDLDVRVTVSSGTYVRALARDLGAALAVDGASVGGHLTALRRTRVGGLTLDDAVTLDELGALVDAGGEVPRVPLGEAASAVLPSFQLTDREATALGYGQAIEPATASGLPEGPVAALAEDGDLVAVVQRGKGGLRPAVVFRPANAGA
ncbi:tRNA pseudouridine(55) synthase TruB [uncultured Demequina sp.]|uniref:tRNA pseudouridine(55) synthase TruB n=1 Tax=uncultured Demequina sp. TaxID=693499 RepID=UPI0025EEDEBA|nr:tRNA pseudouridine(55) synthase TruB [uncultured Demequina sp.]